MSLHTLPAPHGFRQLPSSLLVMDARSPYLLQGTAPGTEGIQQAFPATAADLLTALGSPAGIGIADIAGIYLMNTAAPLVDSLGLGPNLAALGGGELDLREGVGLPDTSFTSKVVTEYTTTNSAHLAVGSDFGAVPANAKRSFLYVVRPRDAYDAGSIRLIATWGLNYAWMIERTAINLINFEIFDSGLHSVGLAGLVSCRWQYICVTFDDATKTANIYTTYGDAPLAYTDTLVDADPARAFSVGADAAGIGSALFQCAYVARIDKLLVKADCEAFWRAFRTAGLGTDPTYTRTGPLTTRIDWALGHVACYGDNQLPVGWNTNATAGDNPLKTGVVCEDAVSFLGLGSDDMTGYIGTNATVTATDGPSGMRDACRVADTDAVNAGYATSGSANLVGATNVPHIFSAYVKSGGVGVNAVYQSYFTGDGGGPELIQNWAIVGAVGAVWRPYIGGAITPVGAAHTAVDTRLIPTDNVGASLGTVDFAEVWGVQNSGVDRLAWRRVATGAAAATGAQTLSYVNAANARYNPARGRLRLQISGFAGTNGAVFLGFGAAAANGALVLDYNAGALRLRIWNNVGALVGTATCGAVTVASHEYVIEWDAVLGKTSVMEGAAVLGSFAGTWTPAAAGPNPIYVGTDAAAANAARCYVNCLFGYDY